MSALLFALILTGFGGPASGLLQQQEPVYDRDSAKALVGQFRGPVLLTRTLPSYTDKAKRAKVEGVVLLEVIIRKDGSLDSFKLLKTLGYGLDEAAIDEIANNWEFRPATLNGRPVDFRAVVQVSFTIRRGPNLFPLELEFDSPLTVQLPLIEDGVIRNVFTFQLVAVHHPKKRKRFELQFEGGGSSWTRKDLSKGYVVTFQVPGIEQRYSLEMRGVGKKSIRTRLNVPTYSPEPAKVAPPLAEHRSLPPYTLQARQAGIEGTMKLRLVVRDDGSIDNIEVTEPLGHGLDEAAVREVARNWKFQPATLNGKPHDFLMSVQLNFKLPSNQRWPHGFESVDSGGAGCARKPGIRARKTAWKAVLPRPIRRKESAVSCSMPASATQRFRMMSSGSVRVRRASSLPCGSGFRVWQEDRLEAVFTGTIRLPFHTSAFSSIGELTCCFEAI